MRKLFAFGLGTGTMNARGEWLEVFFPAPVLAPEAPAAVALAKSLGYDGGNKALQLHAEHRTALKTMEPGFARFGNGARPLVAVFLESDAVPETVPEAYLKLHLLSHRLVKPHGVNLTGLFKLLPNVAWTSRGAVDPAELAELQLAARLEGKPLSVHSVDKFPQMIDYVVPSGVRIADGSRVRLGAYVGSGTTVLQEGLINFNAGTEGPSMVEGRVSAGIFVGAGSDLGGGCSTMGTLSGGGEIVVSIGKNCLIGANAGCGIPLGDDCTIEAGLYLTAATKVRVVTREGETRGVVKARELAGKNGLLFRRNSQSGAVECLPNKGATLLNLELHANN